MLLLWAAVLALATCASTAQALEAVCLPDRVAVAPEGNVTVRALSDAAADASVQVAWSAEKGQVESTADPTVVTWRPGGLDTAPLAITARLTAGADSATCTAQVVVVPSPDRGSGGTIVAVRLLLPPATPEPPGYGLYSYLLFAHRPQTVDETKRMDAALESFLSLGHAEDMAGPRSRLNATIIPIKQALPDDFDQRADKTTWIRNHYAFEHALALLQKLHGVAGNATFSLTSTVWVVSCLHPLDAAADPRPVLVQDLSAVPPRLIALWTSRFEAVTTQPRLYDRHSLDNLSLDLRIVIAHAGDGLEAVRAAFMSVGSTVLK